MVAIFDGTLNPDWEDWSFNVTVSVQDGILITVTSTGFGGLALRGPGGSVPINDFAEFYFEIHDAGLDRTFLDKLSFGVYETDAAVDPIRHLVVGEFATPLAGGWWSVLATPEQMGVLPGGTISRVFVQDQSGNTGQRWDIRLMELVVEEEPPPPETTAPDRRWLIALALLGGGMALIAMVHSGRENS